MTVSVPYLALFMTLFLRSRLFPRCRETKRPLFCENCDLLRVGNNKEGLIAEGTDITGFSSNHLILYQNSVHMRACQALSQRSDKNRQECLFYRRKFGSRICSAVKGQSRGKVAVGRPVSTTAALRTAGYTLNAAAPMVRLRLGESSNRRSSSAR